MGTFLAEAAQDDIDGLVHLLLELRAWFQVVVDEAVQFLGGDLRQTQDHPGRGGGRSWE